jgi:hypothetical protein
LNYINSNLIQSSNNNNNVKKINNEEYIDEHNMSMGPDPDFNVLHLDESTITDLGNFPLFSMENDMNSLLEQLEGTATESDIKKMDPNYVQLTPADATNR